jgi:serine-type D-Ala-D-Ala carboxypeptidase/endopeptidase (penicillin-binding protein 4)
MRRAAIAALALALLAPPAAQASLRSRLAHVMARAGAYSGAYVMDADTNRTLFAWRASRSRVLASNTKLFTSAAFLAKTGVDSSLATVLAGSGVLRSDGTWDGNLYLRGGGDPTFGSRAFSAGYGSNASVETLAEQLAAAGFRRVTGHVYGDESLFDPLRGTAHYGYRASSEIGGALSALSYNHGFGTSDPAGLAARRLDQALEADGVTVRGRPGVKPAPSDATVLSEVRSPTVTQLLLFQNKVSDNFFAEMLMKWLAVSGRTGAPLRTTADPLPPAPSPADPTLRPGVTPFPPPASTAAGARAAVRFARNLGARARLSDGSGLSRLDRASPRSVARLLDRMRDRPDFLAFRDSLPIAGRDGTLYNRMRRGAARGRCRAKTGTLSNVSTLSGYCQTRGGRTVVFSFLMNHVYVYGARAIQDRMARAIAAWAA